MSLYGALGGQLTACLLLEINICVSSASFLAASKTGHISRLQHFLFCLLFYVSFGEQSAGPDLEGYGPLGCTSLGAPSTKEKLFYYCKFQYINR